jgi:hypothetical protein
MLSIKSEHRRSRICLNLGAAMLASIAAACGGTAADDPGSVDLPPTQGGEIQQQVPDTQQNPDQQGSTAREDVSLPVHADSAACGTTPSGLRRAPTQHDFNNIIVGAWQQCSDSSVFGTSEAGLLIDADGRWSKLALVDGQLNALHGWGNEGSWETIDTSIMNGPGVYQLNLNIDGSGTVITIPQIAAEPELMRLDNQGTFFGDYVRIE